MDETAPQTVYGTPRPEDAEQWRELGLVHIPLPPQGPGLSAQGTKRSHPYAVRLLRREQYAIPPICFNTARKLEKYEGKMPISFIFRRWTEEDERLGVPIEHSEWAGIHLPLCRSAARSVAFSKWKDRIVGLFGCGFIIGFLLLPAVIIAYTVQDPLFDNLAAVSSGLMLTAFLLGILFRVRLPSVYIEAEGEESRPSPEDAGANKPNRPACLVFYFKYKSVAKAFAEANEEYITDQVEEPEKPGN